MYLDDILVFGPDFGPTLARLESVLDRLGEAGLKLKAKTPEWTQRASQAMALLLGGRSGEHYGNWSDALRQQPECRLDPPDTTTRWGIWTARMHNSTVCRVLDGLVAARATGHRELEGMNEILRDIPPRRGLLPIPGPARGSPRVDETFPETGE